MKIEKMCCALIVVVFVAGVTALPAAKKKETAVTGPSVKKGDPPPGSAMALSIPQARSMFREAIKKKYVGTVKGHCWACPTTLDSEVTLMRLQASGFTLSWPHPTGTEPTRGVVSVDFKEGQDYLQAYSEARYSCGTSNCYAVASPIAVWPWACLEWTDERDARNIADAFNRLLYAAYHPEAETAAFSSAARAWRENPVKPALGPETDRERVLAENAIKEHNLDSAVEHYERALETQSTWPAGWFNLALIYAEQNNYAEATDCMRHYLELVPDASDAKAAREQMIIWEDKGKH